MKVSSSVCLQFVGIAHIFSQWIAACLLFFLTFVTGTCVAFCLPLVTVKHRHLDCADNYLFFVQRFFSPTFSVVKSVQRTGGKWNLVLVLGCLKNSLRLFETCQTVLCIALLHAVHLRYFIATSILVLSFCFVNLKTEKITEIQQSVNVLININTVICTVALFSSAFFPPIYSVKSFIVNCKFCFASTRGCTLHIYHGIEKRERD